jgi:prepilin-type N-terminal cleavage/methylation domain-containing protein
MKKQAFTLIEVLIATILVGLAIASLLGANMAFTRANGDGAQLSTAEFLVEQIRELTAMKTYNDLSAYNAKTYSPPIGANGEVLNAFSSYTQQITVENVSDTNFTIVVASSNFVRVTTSIYLNGKKITSACWIRAKIPTT